jgi:plasmid stabilization system protein ParE
MRQQPAYQVAPQAEVDIEEIVRYIALDNPNAALMMFERFYDAFRLLGDNPGIGHTRDDLTGQDVLFWTVKPRYHVIYAIRFQPLLIARVLPADMDIAREMRSTKISSSQESARM